MRFRRGQPNCRRRRLAVTVKVERLGEAKEVVTNVKDITIESDEIQPQANVLVEEFRLYQR